MDYVVYLLSSFFLSLISTAAYRYLAIANDWLEHPNHRSSHFIPVPKGAGIVFLLLYPVILAYLYYFGELSLSGVVFWLASLILGIVGLLDDHKNLSTLLRLFFYGAVIVISTLWHFSTEGSIYIVLLVAFLFLWWVNLFNFMDGINGIAGFQAVFLLLAVSVLSINQDNSMKLISLWVSGFVLGFLCWNFPKARVFMGDAGSVFLGAVTGFILLKSSLTIWQMGILTTVFLVDASYTLSVRILTGQKWYSAHRSHAYQKVARELGGHASVVLLISAINIMYIFPLAWWAGKELYYAPLIMLLAWLPLVGLCYMLRAGHKEEVGA